MLGRDHVKIVTAACLAIGTLAMSCSNNQTILGDCSGCEGKRASGLRVNVRTVFHTYL